MNVTFFLCIFGMCAVLNPWMTMAEDGRVDQMRALLKNAGWLSMNRQDIEEDGQRYTVNQMLVPSSDDQVVTADNVDEKIRQVYKLVKCNYARALMNYNDMVVQLGFQCLRINDPIQSLDCLKLYFRIFLKSHATMTVLKSVLAFFYALSPQSLKEKEFYANLMFLSCYFANKKLNESELIDPNGTIDMLSVHAEYYAVKKFLLIFDTLLRKSLIRSCWPKPSHTHRQKYAFNTDLAKNMSNPSVATPQEAFDVLSKNLQFIIQQIGKYYYTHLGFAFDRDRKTTSVKQVVQS